jgi:hypothetical protein
LLLTLFEEHKGQHLQIEDWCGGVIDAVYTNAFTVKKKKVSPGGETGGDAPAEPEETFLRFPTRQTGAYHLAKP